MSATQITKGLHPRSEGEYGTEVLDSRPILNPHRGILESIRVSQISTLLLKRDLTVKP